MAKKIGLSVAQPRNLACSVHNNLATDLQS